MSKQDFVRAAEKVAYDPATDTILRDVVVICRYDKVRMADGSELPPGLVEGLKHDKSTFSNGTTVVLPVKEEAPKFRGRKPAKGTK